MARPLRLEFEDAIYHLLGRGNARQRVLPLEVIGAVAQNYAVPESRLVERGGYGLEARNVAMALVWERCALSLREIGQLFGGIDYSAVAQRIRRINKTNPAGLKKALREMSNV